MCRYWRGRGTVLDKGYNPARLRKSLARCEPATGRRKSRARHAAETKMAARKQVFLSQTHGSLLTVLRFPAVIAQEIAPAISLSSQLRLVAIGGIASALPPCRGARLLVCHLLWSAVSLPLLCSGQGIVSLQTSTPEVEVPYLANVRFGAVCHEDRRSTRRCVTVREMKEGPSRSAIRSHRKLLLVEKAIEGDNWCIGQIGDRLDGKPKERQEHQGVVDHAIRIIWEGMPIPRIEHEGCTTGISAEGSIPALPPPEGCS